MGNPQEKDMFDLLNETDDRNLESTQQDKNSYDRDGLDIIDNQLKHRRLTTEKKYAVEDLDATYAFEKSVQKRTRINVIWLIVIIASVLVIIPTFLQFFLGLLVDSILS